MVCHVVRPGVGRKYGRRLGPEWREGEVARIPDREEYQCENLEG